MTDWEKAEPLIYTICGEYKITPLHLLSTDRHKPLPLARQLVAWYLWVWEGWSMPRIADMLGKETSTVFYYVHNMNRRCKNEPEMKAQCAWLVRTLTLAGAPF